MLEDVFMIFFLACTLGTPSFGLLLYVIRKLTLRGSLKKLWNDKVLIHCLALSWATTYDHCY